MQRIDTSTKATDLFGAGKHGYKDGNVSLGTPATQLNAASFNAVQEEICNVIEATGQALNSESYTQLVTAINALINSAIGTQITTAVNAMAVVPDAKFWSDAVNLTAGITYDNWADIKTFTVNVPLGKSLAAFDSQTYVHIGKSGPNNHAHTVEFRLVVNGTVLGHGYARPDPNVDNDLTWCIPISGSLDVITGSTATVAIQGRVSSHSGSVTTNQGAFSVGKGPVISEINILWFN